MSTPEAARSLLERAEEVYADDAAASRVVAELRARLDEPLRVAIAGKVKAGKSTLVNALLGEQIAATDAGECTMVTTWYRYGASPTAHLVLHSGEDLPITLRRDSGHLVIDLGGRDPAEIRRLDITWPSPILEEMTLVDTPGLGSLTAEASDRTGDLLSPESGEGGIDALIYLLRHRDAADLEALEEFHRRSGAAGTSSGASLNAIGVLSRADELGGGGVDALVRSEDVASTYASDDRTQSLLRHVLPVAGLVSQGAQTLRQVEFETLRDLSRLPHDRSEKLLVSAQRFVTAEDPDLTPMARRAVLERLGLFGVRLALVLLPFGHDDPVSLSEELLRRSGLPVLRRTILEDYGSAALLLKSRTALRGLERLLHRRPDQGTDELAQQLDEVLTGSHDVRELVLRSRLRAQRPAGLDARQAAEARCLLGAHGPSPSERLDVEDTAEEISAAATDALRRWRALALDPLTTRPQREIAETVARTCEILLSSPDSSAPDSSAPPAATGSTAGATGAPARED